MKPQRDKMLHGPQAQREEIVCTSDCVMPHVGAFKHGQRIDADPQTAAILLANPNFKRLKEVE